MELEKIKKLLNREDIHNYWGWPSVTCLYELYDADNPLWNDLFIACQRDEIRWCCDPATLDNVETIARETGKRFSEPQVALEHNHLFCEPASLLIWLTTWLDPENTISIDDHDGNYFRREGCGWSICFEGSVAGMSAETGKQVLPENETITVPDALHVKLGNPDQVREGW